AGERAAKDQVLNLNLATRLLVTALDNGARCAALVGIFKLRAEIVLGIAKIELGRNVRRAQHGHHTLIISDTVPIEYGYHHRAARRLFTDLAEITESGLQPRDADGEARRRPWLPPKQRHRTDAEPA